MPVIRIESIDDARILPYRDLPRSRAGRRDSGFIAEGALLVERLLASRYQAESLFVERRLADQYAAQVGPALPVYVADRQLFQQVIGFDFHRGVLACGQRCQHLTAGQMLSDLPAAETIVVCDAIGDPENLGGLLRNCAAFGVGGVLLGPRCTDPFSRRVLRVSMGTVFKLKLAESSALAEDLSMLAADHQFQLVATVLDGPATRLSSVPRSARTALLFGNEASGLDPLLVARCDQRVTIPMRLGTDSLNVAVASGIFLYHFTQSAAGAASACRK